MAKLSRKQIDELHQALIHLHLDREGLFAGVNPEFFESLKQRADYASQALTDLNSLNGIDQLSDGSSPFETWLRNACLLTQHRTESTIFRCCLDTLLETFAPMHVCFVPGYDAPLGRVRNELRTPSAWPNANIFDDDPVRALDWARTAFLDNATTRVVFFVDVLPGYARRISLETSQDPVIDFILKMRELGRHLLLKPIFVLLKAAGTKLPEFPAGGLRPLSAYISIDPMVSDERLKHGVAVVVERVGAEWRRFPRSGASRGDEHP